MKRESSGGPEPVKTLRYREDEARAKFDRVAGFYYLIMGFMENKVNRQAIVMAEIRPFENVLDAGFGTGWCLERLAARVNGEHPVEAVDFSEGMKAATLKNLRKKGLEGRAVLRMANVKDLPYVNDRFDVVFASFVIDLLEKDDRDRALSEFRRVLRPAGRLVLVSMTKRGRGILRLARFLYEWMYDKWPKVSGYSPSCRPIYVEDEVSDWGRISHRQVSPLVDYGVPFSDCDPVGHQMHGLLNIVNHCWLWIGVYALGFVWFYAAYANLRVNSLSPIAGPLHVACNVATSTMVFVVPVLIAATAQPRMGLPTLVSTCTGGGVDCRFAAGAGGGAAAIGALPGGPYPGLQAIGGSLPREFTAAFGIRSTWRSSSGKPAWQSCLTEQPRCCLPLPMCLRLLPLIVLEERDLLRRHGAEYEVYRKRTPMLVPRWKAG